MSSIMRWRNGLMGWSGITKAPVSHGVEPHDLETGPSLRFRPYPLTPATLAAPTARAVSSLGGQRAYKDRLEKDRNPRQSRHSIASAVRRSWPSSRVATPGAKTTSLSE